jgi:hypothetical protein
MRALCKKSKIVRDFNCIHNGQIYEVNGDNYGYSILINKMSYRMGKDTFSEYFYSPDETKNILRTKLIDKVFNDN